MKKEHFFGLFLKMFRWVTRSLWWNRTHWTAGSCWFNQGVQKKSKLLEESKKNQHYFMVYVKNNVCFRKPRHNSVHKKNQDDIKTSYFFQYQQPLLDNLISSLATAYFLVKFIQSIWVTFFFGIASCTTITCNWWYRPVIVVLQQDEVYVDLKTWTFM